MPYDSMSESAEAALSVVEAPPHSRQSREAKKPKREPNYHVIIWNDEEHSYDYVIDLLMTLFGYGHGKAFMITEQVDRRGKGIAWTGHFELAELKRDQILGYGADPSMPQVSKGAIRASIEPAPE